MVNHELLCSWSNACTQQRTHGTSHPQARASYRSQSANAMLVTFRRYAGSCQPLVGVFDVLSPPAAMIRRPVSAPLLRFRSNGHGKRSKRKSSLAEGLFETPESVAAVAEASKRRVIPPSPVSDPTRYHLEQANAAVRARNVERTQARPVAGQAASSANIERVTGFRSLMPFLRKAMVRLHPDVVAAQARGAEREHDSTAADSSMRDLLRIVGALEVLSAEPAGTQAELQMAMQRRRATGDGSVPNGAPRPRGRSRDWVRGSALLGAVGKLRVVVPAAARVSSLLNRGDRALRRGTSTVVAAAASAASWQDVVIEIDVPPSLMQATKMSEEAAHQQELQGTKPATAVLSTPGHEEHGTTAAPQNTVVLGAAIVENATLCTPSLRARWLYLATQFTTELCTALGIDGVAPSTFRLSKTVKAIAAQGAGTVTATGPAGDAARRMPQAGRLGLEARARRRVSQVQLIIEATDHRTPHSLGKIRPNPWQPLDQERVTTPEERDQRIAVLTSDSRLSSAFIDEDRFCAGKDSLVVVLYQHFEAIQLQDPFWSLAKFVIAAGFNWEPSQLTIYVPWNANSRQIAAYLRDMAPTVLVEARRQSRDDLRASRHLEETDDIARGLERELSRQERVRARRQKEAEARARSGGRSAPSPWAGEWDGKGGVGVVAPASDSEGTPSSAFTSVQSEESDASESDEARLRAFGACSAQAADGDEADEGDVFGSRAESGVAVSPLSSRVLAALARQQQQGGPSRRSEFDAASHAGDGRPPRRTPRMDRHAFESGWERA